VQPGSRPRGTKPGLVEMSHRRTHDPVGDRRNGGRHSSTEHHLEGTRRARVRQPAVAVRVLNWAKVPRVRPRHTGSERDVCGFGDNDQVI
jgi:hypothetical protein